MPDFIPSSQEFLKDDLKVHLNQFQQFRPVSSGHIRFAGHAWEPDDGAVNEDNDDDDVDDAGVGVGVGGRDDHRT